MAGGAGRCSVWHIARSGHDPRPRRCHSQYDPASWCKPCFALVDAVLPAAGDFFQVSVPSAGSLSSLVAAVWLALISHPLLDLTTVYGTQLALPFNEQPFAIGCMSVMDPLFILPLLLGLVAALIRRSRGGWRYNLSGLMCSCTYLVWSMVAQTWVTQAVHRQLLMQLGDVRQLLVTPTTFNTLQWRIVVMTPERLS